MSGSPSLLPSPLTRSNRNEYNFPPCARRGKQVVNRVIRSLHPNKDKFPLTVFGDSYARMWEPFSSSFSPRTGPIRLYSERGIGSEDRVVQDGWLIAGGGCRGIYGLSRSPWVPAPPTLFSTNHARARYVDLTNATSQPASLKLPHSAPHLQHPTTCPPILMHT